MTRGRWLALAALSAALLAACGDPVHDMQREALGGETDGVPRGPLHRPGQPCLVCHSDYGPARMVLSFGGTIYQYDSTPPVPLKDALITLTDAHGKMYEVKSNCAGNFYTQRVDYDPTFPVSVKVTYGSLPVSPMLSMIHRDGSCASCHTDPIGPGSNGHVYAVPAGVAAFPPAGCP